MEVISKLATAPCFLAIRCQKCLFSKSAAVFMPRRICFHVRRNRQWRRLREISVCAPRRLRASNLRLRASRRNARNRRIRLSARSRESLRSHRPDVRTHPVCLLSRVDRRIHRIRREAEVAVGDGGRFRTASSRADSLSIRCSGFRSTAG